MIITFNVLGEIIGKIIESRYISICPIIDKIIDIGRKLPQIIGDFRELSAKLSISKMTGELSKTYRYPKKLLIAHPYPDLALPLLLHCKTVHCKIMIFGWISTLRLDNRHVTKYISMQTHFKETISQTWFFLGSHLSRNKEVWEM